MGTLLFGQGQRHQSTLAISFFLLCFTLLLFIIFSFLFCILRFSSPHLFLLLLLLLSFSFFLLFFLNLFLLKFVVCVFVLCLLFFFFLCARARARVGGTGGTFSKWMCLGGAPFRNVGNLVRRIEKVSLQTITTDLRV